MDRWQGLGEGCKGWWEGGRGWWKGGRGRRTWGRGWWKGVRVWCNFSSYVLSFQVDSSKKSISL